MHAITWMKIPRCPFLGCNPRRLDATVLAQRNVHVVATFDQLQAAVLHVHLVSCHEDRQVLDVFYVRVGIGVDMGDKPTLPNTI